MLMCACAEGEKMVKESENTNKITEEVTPGAGHEEPVADTASDSRKPEAPEESAKVDEAEAASDGPKQVIIYFANWYLGEEPAEKAEVAGLPWDSVTMINHAFWKVAPADGSTETSFERRDAGLAPRTEFMAVSTNPQGDYLDETPSGIDPSMPRNHFAEYAALSEKYPDVNVMISFGGWTDCGYFSEMAYTPEGRASFISSVMELLGKYPFIDGIDIDWEYPGGSNDGERYPEGDGDEGCPIWGSAYDDQQNFAALCKELREAMESVYGPGGKLLTACASASTGWTLPNQDWKIALPYLDYVNAMTYDMAGVWDGVTGFGSSLDAAKGVYVYFGQKKLDLSKFNIGTPMYSTVFRIEGDIDTKKLIGAPIDEEFSVSGDIFCQAELREFERQAVSGYMVDYDEDGRAVMGETFDNGGTGWHFAYEEKQGGSYMYNDDPDSPYYKWFVSYESPLSLQAKLDFIHKYKMAGIIVWEAGEDNDGKKMIKQMGRNLK